MTKARAVNCPRCGTPVPWSEASKWRPFCSERCKLIDLGDWAAERYRIPGVEPPDAEIDDDTPDEPRRN